MTNDKIMLNDWHAVANAKELADGDKRSTQLLERDILIWRSHGEVHAWLDRCPHRGSRLSLGEIRVSNATVYQPRANVTSEAGVKVAYSYRVLRPLTVMLTKEPGAAGGKPSDLILLSIQPREETRIRAWFVLAMNYGHGDPEENFRDFQDTIFYQDKAVLESQRPRRLPLDPGAELHQPADKCSNVYRRWLKEMGLGYGTIVQV